MCEGFACSVINDWSMRIVNPTTGAVSVHHMFLQATTAKITNQKQKVRVPSRTETRINCPQNTTGNKSGTISTQENIRNLGAE
jgi:hypothetical protein